MTKLAVLYLRSATVDQSIKDQLESTTAFAKEQGFTLVGLPFIDEGKSGLTADGRPAFMKLMELVQSRQRAFDHIICHDISRFGRFPNMHEAEYWEYLCKAHGVQLVFMNQHIDNEHSSANGTSKESIRAMVS